MTCSMGEKQAFKMLSDTFDELSALATILSSSSVEVRLTAGRKLEKLLSDAVHHCRCLLEAMSGKTECDLSFDSYKRLVERGARIVEKLADALDIDLGREPLTHAREVVLDLGEFIFGYVKCNKVLPSIRGLCTILEVLYNAVSLAL